jgi:hypothetical protein
MNPSKQLVSILQLRNHLHKSSQFAGKARLPALHPVFTRTMASNTSNPPSSKVDAASTSEPAHQSSSDAQPPSQTGPLPLPEPSSDATQLNVNGEGVKLDHLGPLVVNKDGSLSRIANWDKMAEIEKQNTLRILGKRNQLRLGSLKSEGKEEGK